MADVTELRCWPSCVNAIDWSQDGIIALASDERVELLFPNTVNFERDQDIPQWQHVPLKVPLFSAEELPVREPAPLQSFSIGQEISNSTPMSLAWSPPGLAKHRRCALAVLTTNLVLSIWTTEGNSHDESSWNRTLIINDALNDYHSANIIEGSYHAIPLEEEILRLRSRVRAFVWAPALASLDRACVVGTHLSYGQHIIAVANDDNQIAFIAVRSHTSTNGTRKGWVAEVLVQFSVVPDPKGIFTMPASFEDTMEQQRHVSHLAWSPWVVEKGQYRSIIVYATNHNLRGRVVTSTHSTLELGNEIIYSDTELRFNGPMSWSPMVEGGDKLRLAVFTAAGLLCLTISAHDGSVLEIFSHDLDGRWDEISGTVWDTAQSKARLHISSLTSTLSNSTVVLEVSSNGLVPLSSPNWRDQIENSLALFSVKNDLKGNGKAKVWGLAKSPLGDFIAASNSVHPSNMIEYGPPGDRRSTVAISTLRQYRQIREAFPPWDVSAEGIVFTVKKLAGNLVEDADQMPVFAEEVVDKLLQAYGGLQDAENFTDLANLDMVPRSLDTLIGVFKKATFFDTHTLRDRYAILVARACNTALPEDLPRVLIAYRLAVVLQQSPPFLLQTAFSAEIQTHHQHLISLIDSLTIESHPETETLSKDPEVPDQVAEKTTSSPNNKVIISQTDTCDFCSAPIPFTDLASASCTNGHTFPRCGLSLIAIQAPGITKYCGICSTPFFNDEFVTAQEKTTTKANASPNNNANAEAENTADPAPGADPLTINTQATTQPSQQQNDIIEDTQDSNEDMQDSPTTNDPGGNEAHSPITLARLLFLACDACIYCGGKFVG